MNNYEDWAQLVAKNLEHESSFLAAIDKDELDDKAATEAFIRGVLEPFLPENYGIGAGRVVDAFGKASDFLDVIVYNRDFPRIGMRGTHHTYLYESVLAAFAIRAKFVRKTFFDALNACASISHLDTKVDQAVLVKLAKKNGLKPGPNKTFVHDDPLRTARFELIGRPPAFVFGFSGFKYSYRQLQENVELWIENRKNVGIATPMKALPAVIATQGCFAWRNAAPLALSNREMLGIGNDDAPVRLIALQLLYLLNRRLGTTSDGYGLKPNLSAYLSQFSAPRFEVGVGNMADVVNISKADDAATRAARDTQRFEAARDHAAISEAASRAAAANKPAPAPEPPAVAKPAAEPAPEPPSASKPVVEPVPEPPAASKPVVEPASEPPAAKSKPEEEVVFDKPSPFASAPIPPAETPAPVDGKPAESAVFDKPSPFAKAPPPAEEPAAAAEPLRSPAPVAPLGSAPIPMQGSDSSMPLPEPELVNIEPSQSSQPSESSPPAAPLGSAPIPPSEPARPTPSQPPAAAKVIPPKPPVDIDLGIGDGDSAAAADKADSSSDDDDDFIETVVIPPNASLSNKDKTRNSTDAFIARVKEQLSTSEPAKENEQDFTSTIPQ